MTVIACAYDSPTSYALAADTYGQVNGLRIPSLKCIRVGPYLFGGAGCGHEMIAGFEFLSKTDGTMDLRTTLAEMRRYILATTERTKDCVGLDSHYIAVGPGGILVLGSNGGIEEGPSRWAVGCGEHVAIGAMYRREGSPAEVVRLAVEAASALVSGCFGEARVLTPD
jgi:hypothetical protein